MKESELLNQLGVLSTQLVKSREKVETHKHIKKVLSSTPFETYKDGSMGKTDSRLKIIVSLPKNKGEVELAGKYSRSSNYAHSTPEERIFGSEELRHLADQPTIIQLAHLLLIHGKPLVVEALYKEYDCWEGSQQIDESWEVKFIFP